MTKLINKRKEKPENHYVIKVKELIKFTNENNNIKNIN